ncbi:hypothetical protein BHE74_00002671 [Ensete ventricosum]|nr:hypothetical protein GW17_00020809 [Ensete ventricosum]RWW88454.1 hypothetical protein BHE74_00002671 [Ensete ventricosum]RZR93145.1 hypothetical protein BHM03_00021569 [Ensete ventricosum]
MARSRLNPSSRGSLSVDGGGPDPGRTYVSSVRGLGAEWRALEGVMGEVGDGTARTLNDELIALKMVGFRVPSMSAVEAPMGSSGTAPMELRAEASPEAGKGRHEADAVVSVDDVVFNHRREYRSGRWR